MKYVTPYKYAKLCGVTTQAIYKRIQKGQLTVKKIKSPDGTTKTYIDTDKFPPERLKNKF